MSDDDPRYHPDSRIFVDRHKPAKSKAPQEPMTPERVQEQLGLRLIEAERESQKRQR